MPAADSIFAEANLQSKTEKVSARIEPAKKEWLEERFGSVSMGVQTAIDALVALHSPTGQGLRSRQRDAFDREFIRLVRRARVVPYDLVIYPFSILDGLVVGFADDGRLDHKERHRICMPAAELLNRLVNRARNPKIGRREQWAHC